MSENPPPLAEELLVRLGRRLRTAREARGMTVQEISSQTRINPAFITKIEEGNLQGLPGLTFVRGFIRNYMQALQLEDEDIEADVRRFAISDQYLSETTFAPKITQMYEETESRSLPFQKTVITALVVVLVVWGAYMLYRVFSRSEAPDAAQVSVTEKAPVEVAEKAQQKAAGKSSVEEAQTAQKKAPNEQPAEAAPPNKRRQVADQGAEPAKRPLEAPQNLRLTVRGLEPTWLRLSIDRAPSVEVRVEPAETLNWDANEEIRLVIGKSQGVAIYLNGEDILLPSERDQLIPIVVLNKLTLLRLEN